MHSHDIWHRDLKPHNLLVFADGKIVIADLGLARFGVVGGSIYTQPVQTLWYRAPELLLGAKEYGAAIDVFSLGAIFAQMIIKEYFFHGNDEEETLKVQISKLGNMTVKTWPGISGMVGYTDKIQEFSEARLLGKFDAIFAPHLDRIGEDGIQLMRQMMWPNPQKRITMDEVMKSSYFTSIKGEVCKVLPAPPIVSNICGDVIQKDTIDPVILTLPKNIRISMIEILYNWLMEVKNEYNLSNESIFMARRLVDIYINLRPSYDNINLTKITRANLQLIGISALFIAVKIFEIYPPGVEDFTYVTDNSYNNDQILGTEASILRVLKFNLVFPLMSEYLNFYGEGLSPKAKTDATNLCLVANVLGELIDIDETVQSCIYISVIHNKEPQPKCLVVSDNDKATDLIKRLKRLRKKFKDSFQKVDLILDTWNVGTLGAVGTILKAQTLVGTQEIVGLTTPTRTDITTETSFTFRTKLQMKVTRAESENVSRNDVGDFIKDFLVDRAITTANMLHMYQPKISQNLIDTFFKYFKLTKLNNDKYILGDNYQPPQRIEISLGPMTIDTTTTINFNQVPDSIRPLMDIYSNLLTNHKYDNGKIAAYFE